MDKPPPRPRGPPPKPSGSPPPPGAAVKALAPPRGPRSPPPPRGGVGGTSSPPPGKPPPSLPPPKKPELAPPGAKQTAFRPPPGGPPVTSAPGKPAGSPPIPSGRPPVPTGRPPIPSGSPPIPSGRPPVPAGSPPVPAGRPPVPSGSPPIPSGRPPVPAGSPPVPAGRPPVPGGSPPIPGGRPPVPAGRPPVPAGRPPVPAGRPPVPAGSPPVPIGSPPVPAGRPPVPAGSPPGPGGRPPPPAGRPPPPGGRPPPPGGRPPPPAEPPQARKPSARPPPPVSPPPEARASGIGRPPPPRSPPPPAAKIPRPPIDGTIPGPPEVEEEKDSGVPPPPEPETDIGIDEDLPPEAEEDGLHDMPEELPKLIPGRFIIEVLECSGLRKHDATAVISATKIDPYVKATLGFHKSAPTFKGRVHKNQGGNVKFEEKMVLDMLEPEAFIAENDIQLQLVIMNSNVLSDTVLAQAEVSVVSLLANFEKEGTYNMYYRKKKRDPKESAGTVRLRMRFRPAKAGYLVVTCKEGRKMKNMELMGKQDPYCKFEMGKQKPKRTKTIKNGGTDCSFGDEQVMLAVTWETWTEPLRFSVYDEDIGADDLIGARVFDLLDFMTDAKNATELEAEGMGRVHEEWYEVFQGKNLDKLSGEILLRFQFYPAGKLLLTSIEGRHLVDKDTMGKQDPFIVYNVPSDHNIMPHKYRTKTDKDGGINPRWDETKELAIVEHHEMSMEVYDEDTFGSNDLIGKATFSLLPVFRKGVIDTWVTLKNKDNWGRVNKCGDIHVRLEFFGPPKVGYPLLQPNMDSFDDSERENKPVEEVEAPKEQEERPPNLSNEFTDDEIEQSFHFLDLNKNGFIGASELKHLLICMGELITDEEIDEMIRMVDGDGDGQVSFEEYAALMLHPDPASPSFQPAKVLEAKGGPMVLGLDAKEVAAQREQDAATKREKMVLMKVFAEQNGVKMPFLQRAFDKYKLLDRAQGGNCSPVDFSSMCDILLVEPVGEYKKLFKILDYNNEGRVDMRELLLGLSNFAGAELEARCNFCFTMFDDDGSGTLDRDELTDIVKAIHLASDRTAVKRKVDTIMKQCDNDGSETIDRDEFVMVARKFPNLLMNANFS